MSPSHSNRPLSRSFETLRSWLIGPPAADTARARKPARHLGFESLETRTVLSGSPGASILGTAFNDLTGNGLTADDPRLAGVTVNLYHDGGDGTFEGSGAGTDDTLVGSQQTGGSGKYEFDNLTAGTYFLQEINPSGFTLESAFTQITKIVVTSADAAGVVGKSIDSFGTSQTADASSLGSTTSASSIVAPEALGGHRDMFAQLTTAAGDVNLISNAYDQHLLEYNSSATGNGTRTVTWDGDNSATPGVLNPTGLDHVDLTSNGTVSGVNINIGADHANGQLTFRVYKDANNWSTATVAIPNTGGTDTQPVFLPFSSFTVGGGSGAGDFTDVGALQLQINGGAAVNGQVSTIGTLGATPLVNNVGFYQPAGIGDLVFWDLNKSGIQASTDPGVAGATVQLLQNGSVVATTTTNAQGGYSFEGVVPGAYSVKFIAPHGALFTLQHQGSNTALDSDPDPATGVTQTFTVTSGEEENSIDAGVVPIDLSLTKTVDNSAPNIGANVVFTITVSNAAGYSQATGVTVNDVLPAGLSFVSATPTAGTYNSSTGVWNVGSVASGASDELTITATVTNGGQKTNTAQVTAADETDIGTNLEASASLAPPASVGDFVFWDINKSGIQTSSDPGVAGATVQLLQNGAVVATTTSNAQGAYHFIGVTPGTYSLKFIAPHGALFTAQHQGSNTALDSDPDPSTGITQSFTLASGQDDTSLDAGLLPVDLSVTKSVDNPTPTVGNNVVFTITLSNAAGFSGATGVTVNDVLPAGLNFVSATPAAGSSYDSGTGVWNVGSLASGASTTLIITATVTTGGVKTNTAQVTGSDENDISDNLQASASVTPPGSIGDFVFWDLNKSGIQTSSDPGVAGATVQLLQNGSVVASTTTNAQGIYGFSGVNPGTYNLKFITPDGALLTLQHQGTDPALDSDPDPTTGITQSFTVVSGQNDTSLDAGVVPIDLSLTKTVNNPTPTVGATVVFAVSLSNASGYSAATGVSVRDLLPAGLNFVSAAPAAGTTYNSSTGVWNVGTLASGATTTLTITATVATAGVKTNTAQVTGNDENDIGTNLQSSASVTPIVTPKVVPTVTPKLSKAFFLGR